MLLIEYYRRVKCLTQLELADAVGIAQPKISQLENGRIKVGVETLRLIAVKIGFPFNDLGDLYNMIDKCEANENTINN